MIRIGWLFHIVAFYSCFSLIFCSLFRNKQPLIFNPYSLEMYSSQDPKNKYVFACPSENEEETQFIEKAMLRSQSLFIREYSYFWAQEGRPIRCKDDFKLSVVYRYPNNLIEFGYEVYYKGSEYSKDFTLSKIDDYGSITEARSVSERVEKYYSRYYPLPHETRRTLIYKWEFIWISKIALQFDISSWSLISLRYWIHPVAIDRLVAKCHDKELAADFYKSKEELEDFYKVENQEKYFKQVKLPASIDKDCELRYNCVKEYNLVRPYHFQASPSEPILCSKLTSIPIWHRIPETLLDNMELFITAIAQVTGNKLEIIPGVLDVLSFPSSSKKNELQKLYLRKKKVPIPKIIYKIIRYNVPQCDQNVQLSCWFDIVIFIHNQTEITKEEKLCPDKCSEWGWDSIQYLETEDSDGQETKKIKNEYVYCCELNKKIMKKIGYKKSAQVVSKNLNLKTQDVVALGYLNLKNFPQYNITTKRVEYVNKHVKFQDKMEDITDEIRELKKKNSAASPAPPSSSVNSEFQNGAETEIKMNGSLK